MQLPFIGRRAVTSPDRSACPPDTGAVVSVVQAAEARSSLIVMLAASTLAMIAINSSQGRGFRGLFGFFDTIRSGLDATLVDWLGRPLAVGALFLIGLAGGAALWPWRKGGTNAAVETALPPAARLQAEVADSPVARENATASSQTDELVVVELDAAADEAHAEEAAILSRIASLRSRALADEDPTGEAPHAEPSALGESAAEADLREIVQDEDQDADSACVNDETMPIDPAVLAALRQAIVFRQDFPPEAEPGLCFYGGAPIAPPRFVWPCRASDGKPLHFLLQVDCAAIADDARLGLLPESGVLYFFVDLGWEDMDAVSVVHEADPDETWDSVVAPADLDPVFGDEARYSFAWINPYGSDGDDALPRLLPRWPFRPTAITLPADERSDEQQLWWRDCDAVYAELARVQGEVTDLPFAPARDADGSMHKPYPEFPHDWRAVAITSIAVIEKLRSHLFTDSARRHGHDDEQIEAIRSRCSEEALECLAWARSNRPFKAVPAEAAAMFWDWLVSLEGIGPHDIRHAAGLAVEATLSGAPKAARRLGPDALALIRSRHALAVKGDHGPFAPTPNRMLAPASFVQGFLSGIAADEVLLLEVGSCDAIGHRFGDGVYQFTISPEDLRARRFDKVRLTASTY